MNQPQHIERLEHDEVSSAGWETRRFQLADQTMPIQGGLPRPAPLAASRNRNNVAGMVLIAAGVLFWLTRAVGNQGAVTAGTILLTGASSFLFFAFWRRLYLLLIPGCILAGLSIGVPLAALTHGISVLWGLSLGFTAIYILGRELFNVRVPWAVFPAAPLFGVGIIIAITSLPTFLAAGLMWLPLLLIGAGLYLGWGWQRP